jgi:hypothetical protein
MDTRRAALLPSPSAGCAARQGRPVSPAEEEVSGFVQFLNAVLEIVAKVAAILR